MSTATARFTTLREPISGRWVHVARAACGLEVWVAPMPGFRKAYAAVTTRYGSVDTALPDGTPLPEGIAHFLEHKMFQTADGDVFDLYEARGASANAFTTFTHTSYLFAATTGFRANLDTLLETMDSITTTSEGIEREKGIIGQELAMYDDDPGWQGYFRLLQGLYRRHPVRIDIGGSAATIAPIDAAILERAHQAFYSPANMVLTVAGDVDPAAVLARVDAVLGGRRRGRRNRRPAVVEPTRVARRESRHALAIGRPHVWLGLKDRPRRGPAARVRARLHGAMLIELLCGDGGMIQAPLYAEGLIDDSFGGAYEGEDGYAFAWIAAEVDAVEPYRRRLRRALRDAAALGVEPEALERCRRRFHGRHLRAFNTPEGCANWMLGVALEGVRPGALHDALRRATPQAFTRRLRALAGAPQAWSILEPRTGNRPSR